ncbi:MAG: hypothetical protein IKN63_06360 [Bacilli bacterium]|nr:hypothetical protein [Bacilli bacterium]
MENNIKICCKLILNYIDSLIASNNSQNIILDFFISENYLFLNTKYKKGSNIVITYKTKLNIDVEEVSLFYQELFDQFKGRYVDDNSIKVQMLKKIDFCKPIYYLSCKLHDKHLNEVDLRFKDLGKEKEVIDNIENQIIDLYTKKKTIRK